MPNWIEEDFSQGQVNSKDPMELSPGEVQDATGLYYKPNDKRLHVVPGRGVFADTGSGAEVAGIKVCQFDNGSDKVVALSGTTLYGATPGTAGTFTSLKSGLTSSPELLSAAHYDDRWYLTNGLDRNMVLEDDGTVRTHGMDPQTEAFTVTPDEGTGNAIRPTAPASGITDAANTMDSDLDTFGTMPLSSGSATATFSGNEWTGAGASRQLIVKYALDNGRAVSREWYGDDLVITREGASVTILFEISTDGGTVWTTILSGSYNSSVNDTDFQYAVSADPDLVQFRVTFTYSSGTTPATLRIYDVRLQEGSAGAAVGSDTTVTYAVAEYDATRGVQSVLSPEVEATLLSASSHNQVTLDLSGYTAKNSTSTHWRIYRKPTDGTAFGLVSSTLDIAQTSYVDDFASWGYTEQPTPVYEELEYRSSETSTSVGVLREPLYATPPTMSGIRSFKGHLIGWYGRAVYYSAPGLPEYWPAAYVITRIPLQEHDTLITGEDLGDYFVFGCKGAILRVENLPIVINGMFIPGEAKQIPGAPGCVGKKAMTRFSVSGQAYAAWISPYGIYATNGVTIEHISQDWNWDNLLGFDKSGWVLHWDPEWHTLRMAYSSTASGDNDRYAVIHMHPSQIKDGSPKITWGHYGPLNDLGHAQVGNQRRLYSAHPSDGKVYIEDYGTTDAANTYDSSGSIPWSLQMRRMQGNASDWSALGVRLGHTDFGTGEEASVAWKYGRDNSSRTIEETKTTTVSLAGHKRTLFDVGRGGEWHEPTLSGAVTTSGSLLDMQIRARALGAAGKVSV